MAQLQGALAQLPLYGAINGQPMIVSLRYEIGWIQAKAARRKANEQHDNQPVAARQQDVDDVLASPTISDMMC